MTSKTTTYSGSQLGSINLGTIAVLNRPNIDTDQIIPKQFLKSVERTGFGDYLFDSWRFTESGELGMKPEDRELQADFPLNSKQTQGARFLIAGENFGCGSSREHAVWALQQYGFCAIIAPSFAEIFADNSQRNGLALVELSAKHCEKLIAISQDNQLQATLDLEKLLLSVNDETFSFSLPESVRDQLISGMDDIDASLLHVDAIRSWEENSKALTPWLWTS